jgi:hypothetical protein
MKRLVAASSVLALAAVLLLAAGGASGQGRMFNPLKAAALGKLKAPHFTVHTKSGKTFVKRLPFISGGTIAAEQEALGVGFADERAGAADANADIPDSQFSDIGGSEDTLGCARRNSDGGVRVNQDCSFRRQAETDITYNPVHPRNLVAGQNDSRSGFNQCGIDFSIDNGQDWGDMLPPFRQRLNAPEAMGPTADNPNNNTIAGDPGTFHTYDAASDPANAVDSSGRAFFSCVVFDVASNASGVFVTQSPQGAEGSFYFNVPSPPEKRFMAVEDNNFDIFHDKNMISADRYKSSPNHDNVYLTWTVFKFGPDCLGGTDTAPAFCESPIFGSMSTDHGITWSTPEEISGAAPGLCQFGDVFTQNPANANDCNFDQGSYSVALPNGDLEVVFNNGNTPSTVNHQLGVHCSPTGSSSAGTAHFNCDAPVKVGDDVATGEPECDFGRGPEECIPGPFIRTNDYPRITKDNTRNNHLYTVWQDYRNGEFDIQMSRSTDGGVTWHEVGTVNPDSDLDHYFAATDQSPKRGDQNGVSYYRSDRVPDESSPGSGFFGGSVFAPCNPDGSTPKGADLCAGVAEQDSDYVLAGGSGGHTPYAFMVVSPVFPPPDGEQAGFNGDYSGLTVNRGVNAHPFWSDTRNSDPYAPDNGVVKDEDGFTVSVGLPKGKGKKGPGQLGKR